MAIVTRWDNKKKTVVLLEFESEWSWEELEEAVQKADRMIGGVEHFVDLIIDLEGTNIPRDVLTAAKTLLASGEARPQRRRARRCRREWRHSNDLSDDPKDIQQRHRRTRNPLRAQYGRRARDHPRIGIRSLAQQATARLKRKLRPASHFGSPLKRPGIS